MRNRKKGVLCAVLAAAFYALNAPVSKLLLGQVPPAMMAAFLYLGAGLGMGGVLLLGRRRNGAGERKGFARRDMPYVIGMVLLDIAAPVFLMFGIRSASAANVSLLNNFEIVATSLIALCIFGERISPKLWLGIALVTLSSILLSVETAGSFAFTAGSLWVLAACLCWGLENNCTRMLSHGDPVRIVVVKGLGSGVGALGIALCIGEKLPGGVAVLGALGLGFVAYGLSIALYIYAQRELGAARTSAYYAVAPFIGVTVSLIIFREIPTVSFYAALAIMAAGTYAVTVADT